MLMSRGAEMRCSDTCGCSGGMTRQKLSSRKVPSSARKPRRSAEPQIERELTSRKHLML